MRGTEGGDDREVASMTLRDRLSALLPSLLVLPLVVASSASSDVVVFLGSIRVLVDVEEVARHLERTREG